MKKLPNAENAYIPPKKLFGYLLSTTHATGKGKANFFRHVGFDEDNMAQFTQALLSVAQNGGMVQTMETQFGQKFVVDGSLSTPARGIVQIRTVWIVEPEEHYPRFVTAYPKRA